MLFQTSLRLLFVFIVAMLIAASSFAAQRNVIIVFKNAQAAQGIRALDASLGGIAYSYSIIPAIALSVNDTQLAAFLADPTVASVYDDVLVHASLDNSVPQIQANYVHQAGIIGTGAKVCIVDTGVDQTQVSLPTPLNQYDFVNSDNIADDQNGHGTHVAGIVASHDSVYTGVAPGANIYVAKVLGASGSGSSSTVIAGIDWCVSQGAQIITMSLGEGNYTGHCDSDPVAMAGNNAFTQGIVVVAASGNEGNGDSLDAPACGSNVIAVGAVDKSDVIAPYSNKGSALTVVAPGSLITSTHLGGGFITMSGTSMATPHVAGVAALLLGATPSLTAAQVRTKITTTAKDLGGPGFDTTFGYGRVDAYAAVFGGSPPGGSTGAPPLAANGVASAFSSFLLVTSALMPAIAGALLLLSP